MRDEVGVPTILVNNAGVGPPAEDFCTTPTQTWEPIIELNIKAGLYIIR